MIVAGSGLSVDSAAAHIKRAAAKQQGEAQTESPGEFSMLVDAATQSNVEPDALPTSALPGPMIERSPASILATVGELHVSEGVANNAFGPNRPQLAEQDCSSVKSAEEERDAESDIGAKGAPIWAVPDAILVAPPPLLRSRENAAEGDGISVAAKLPRTSAAVVPGAERVLVEGKVALKGPAMPPDQVYTELFAANRSWLSIDKPYAGVTNATSKSFKSNPAGNLETGYSMQNIPAPVGVAASNKENTLGEGQSNVSREGDVAPRRVAPELSPSSTPTDVIEVRVLAGADPTQLATKPLFHQVARALADFAATPPTTTTQLAATRQVAGEPRELMIELKPDGLGCIVATLTRVSGQLQVRLRPDSELVAQQLLSDIGNLSKVLAAVGVSVREITIAVPSEFSPSAFSASMQDGAPGAGARGHEAQSQRRGEGQGERARTGRETPSSASSGASASSSGRSYVV